MSLYLLANNGQTTVMYQVDELSKATLDKLAQSYKDKDRAIVYGALAEGYTPGQALALAAYAAPDAVAVHNLVVP